jgi:DnaK suppressor protein
MSGESGGALSSVPLRKPGNTIAGPTEQVRDCRRRKGVAVIMTVEHKKDQMSKDRYAELQRILEERRREIVSKVHEKIRDVRTEGQSGQEQGVLDSAESSEADIQEEIELALIQMKTETLSRIDEALNRLEEGTYGYCFECGEEIAERRLRALPFAVRCKDCEEAREVAEQRERVMAQRRGAASLFLDMSS